MNRWQRRAAAAVLIPAARQGLYAKEIFRLCNRLLADEDDMVQKAVGWLLKESTKKKRPAVVSYLVRLRARAPRLVLRYACENLPAGDRRRTLA